ncbi:MAG: class I SAM-dependent methyltransferase [Cytophagales bacterium]|nr:class I SAM-dependent methyltransferase [Cytophagales bacterium]
MKKNSGTKRYTANESTYGFEPNEFFKAQITQLKPGHLLLPAEGEGRNALYAAKLGWKVTAYDFSEVARIKTLNQAMALGLTSIEYHVQDLSQIQLSANTFDAVGLIYSHLPEPVRRHLHQQSVSSLKVGGNLILEAFSKTQTQYNSGGPKDPALLYSVADLKADFSNLQIEVLEELKIELKEGPFHSGPASVVRLVATKI